MEEGEGLVVSRSVCARSNAPRRLVGTQHACVGISACHKPTMAAESLAEYFLRDHPDLRPFLFSSARATGRTIGSGSYGSVEEVAVPGAVCAAKKIHDFFQDPRQMPREGIEKAANEFVRECQLMSTLRHPHIVQFLGVCFLPGSRMPALVMEKLATSLHDILDPEPPPPTKPFVPVSLKRSILHDVAHGLSFLHSHSPPIIHRDLSARNVLLNEGMVAKIADLGVARILPGLRASTMTKAPGASIYMPPEALEDESRYDITIDIFSLGVLAIFTLSQMFPKPLAAAYIDSSRKIVGRTELERRAKYMQEVTRQFQEGHPFIRMIQRCLNNRMRERPSIQQVMGWLEEARAEVQDGEYDVNKLSLAQLLHSRNLHIQQQRQEIDQQQQQIQQRDSNLIEQSDENRCLKEQNDIQKAHIQYLQVQNAALKQSQKVCVSFSCHTTISPFFSPFQATPKPATPQPSALSTDSSLSFVSHFVIFCVLVIHHFFLQTQPKAPTPKPVTSGARRLPSPVRKCLSFLKCPDISLSCVVSLVVFTYVTKDRVHTTISKFYSIHTEAFYMRKSHEISLVQSLHRAKLLLLHSNTYYTNDFVSWCRHLPVPFFFMT